MTLNSKRALTVAIDTSTDMLVCALRWTDLETGEEHMLSRDHMCRRHANVELVNTVQAALAEAGFGIADVDGVVVGRGPGSFTGLRIGAATAKGLGLALKKPLVHVPTVDAMAYNMWGAEGLICPIMDAKRSQVYTGLYHTRDGLEVVLTGRDPAPWMREAADYSTEMRCHRHPYARGVLAREGVEF